MLRTKILTKKAKIFNLSFSKLTSELNKIEKDIITDAFEIINDVLICNEYKKDGICYIKDKFAFTIEVNIDECSRRLNILFNPLNQFEKSETNTRKINEFGFIKEINIISCNSSVKEVNQILCNLRQYIIDLYLSIEHALVFHAETATNQVNSRMKLYLKSELSKVTNNSNLSRKYRFYIFHKKIGICLIDAISMRSIIKHFKSNQNERYSPLQLTIWTLTEKIPFEHSLTKNALKENKILQTPWSDAKFISSATKAFISNSHVFDFIDYKIFPIDSQRDYVSSIIYSADIKDTLEPILEDIHPALKTQFQQDIANYSIYYRILSKMKSNIESTLSTDKAQLISYVASETLIKVYNGIKIGT